MFVLACPFYAVNQNNKRQTTLIISEKDPVLNKDAKTPDKKPFAG
jgi:hypothetical protein